MSDEDARFEPGVVVDERYELIERLDGVGLGETWRARDPNIPTRVFTLKPLGAADGDEVPEALSEHIRELRTLRHAGILPTTGRGVWGGRVYLVMGPLEGVSLARYVSDQRAAPLALAAIDAIVQQIGAALGAAHRLTPPVAHGDLQPDVVVIARGEDGSSAARVMDFGLAAYLDARAMAQGKGFVAPERKPGVKATPAMDVFSLGRLLRWSLAEPSRTGPAKVLADGFRGRGDVPGAVWKLIEKATSAAPEARHPSVQALLAELKDAWAAPVEVEAAAPVEEKPVVKVSGAPPKLFEEAPRAPVLAPVVAQEMPPLPPPPEEPTEDIGQFLAQQPPAPVGDTGGTEFMRRRGAVAAEPPRVAPSAPPVAAPPSQRAPATKTVNPDNPWATELLRRRVVVPEQAAAPVVAPAPPPSDLWGGTEVVSRSSSFGASASDATLREEQLSPVSGTLVGAPAFPLDEQVTTIERRKPPSAAPVAPVPVVRGPVQAPPMHDGALSGTLSEQTTALMRREGAAPKRGGSRVVIAGAVVAFVAGVALVVVLMGVLGVLPTAR